ncbi:MAG: tetratricopeptide repeat protein [Burkholderiales bacterium]
MFRLPRFFQRSRSAPADPSATAGEPAAIPVSKVTEPPVSYEGAQSLLAEGRAQEARTQLERLVATEPGHARALNLLGVIAQRAGDAAAAVGLLERAVRADAGLAGAQYNLGNALAELGRFEPALEAFEAAVRLEPGHADALCNRGLVLQQLQRHEAAAASFEQALALRPDDAELHAGLAESRRQQGRLDDALAAYWRVAALQPENPEAQSSLGNALQACGQHEPALASYERALRLAPDHVATLTNQAALLRALGRSGEALAVYDRLVQVTPGQAEPVVRRASVLNALERFTEALAGFDAALSRDPQLADAHFGRGLALHRLDRLGEALPAYDRAIALDPEHADAHNNRGLLLHALRRVEEAIASYEQALRIRPDQAFLLGTLQHAKMRVCDWRDFDALIARLETEVLAGRPVTMPFAALSLTDNPAVHAAAARSYAQSHHPAPAPANAAGRCRSGGRIRLGYFSADFYTHATAYLVAELLERHDRAQFEVMAFALGPARDDAMRRRIMAGVDRFSAVGVMSDAEAIRLAREAGVDIAIDLNGYTQDSRSGIFAGRCAPVQVNFLAYPGTMASACMDYIVADHTVIAPQAAASFTEKVVRMPHSYQVNDSRRQVSDRVFTRAELGLPEDRFVYCSFNNTHKILPSVFDAWMRILSAVPGSVLWLLQDNPQAANNLRQHARQRGVDPGRLVFAGRVPTAEHLSRHRQADLFLDTFPYNAHTTASDALWMALPVLTRPGQSFPSRVAASLLRAVGLPELIADTPEDYERMAIALARDPQPLASYRQRLDAARLSAPLFDTARFARDLEWAYRQMHQRNVAGLEPADITVPDELPSAVER